MTNTVSLRGISVNRQGEGVHSHPLKAALPLPLIFRIHIIPLELDNKKYIFANVTSLSQAVDQKITMGKEIVIKLIN